MRGHSNWVKNIEYSAKDNYLVTSGFDGAIFAWDINKFNHDDGSEEASNIFYTGLCDLNSGLFFQAVVKKMLNLENNFKQ